MAPGALKVQSAAATAKSEEDASRAPAVTRALAILQLLSTEGSALGVTHIARRLDLNPSTCLHIMRALEAASFVQQTPGSKLYVLGPGIHVLARRGLSQDPFLLAAQPCLEELSSRFKCTALVMQPDNDDHMVVTAIVRDAGLLSLHIEVGSRVPALIAASGRCVAAHSRLPVADLRRGFDKLKWDEPPRFEDWLDEVEQTRRSGVGADCGAFVTGVSMYATAILRNEAIWRVISLVTPRTAFARKEVGEITTALRAAAERLQGAI